MVVCQLPDVSSGAQRSACAVRRSTDGQSKGRVHKTETHLKARVHVVAVHREHAPTQRTMRGPAVRRQAPHPAGAALEGKLRPGERLGRRRLLAISPKCWLRHLADHP